jgi:hypothetical protein
MLTRIFYCPFLHSLTELQSTAPPSLVSGFISAFKKNQHLIQQKHSHLLTIYYLKQIQGKAQNCISTFSNSIIPGLNHLNRDTIKNKLNSNNNK